MAGSHTKAGLFVRGMAMGAADVVPGVSGGTVAFITGIYEELIESLGAANMTAVKLLLGLRIKDLWQHLNGNFLVLVFAGILFSIFSLAKLISWALITFPHIIWAYFFGLIAASVIYIARHAGLRDARNLIALVLGAAVAFSLTQLTQVAVNPSIGFVFVAGAIAICAMILPGISGSFILVLLGMYQYIIAAVKELNGAVLVVFALGCISGLLTFTHLLSWLLRRFHQLTLAVLTGFMVGSLAKVWPWKHLRDDGNGAREFNVWPNQYELLHQQDAQLLLVLLTLCLGIATVYTIDRFGNVRSGS